MKRQVIVYGHTDWTRLYIYANRPKFIWFYDCNRCEIHVLGIAEQIYGHVRPLTAVPMDRLFLAASGAITSTLTHCPNVRGRHGGNIVE